MTRELSGKCACEAVSYMVADDFKYAANCHCSVCRRATGSMFKPFGRIESDALRLTKGGSNLMMVGGDIDQRHTRLDAILEIYIFFQVLGGPEVHQLNRIVHAADAVNASEALYDANRVPVDVVIDEIVAILKILSFRNAVRRDEQIDFGCS